MPRSSVALVAAVDGIGGITVTLDTPVRDANAHLDLPAGEVHVDGLTALAADLVSLRKQPLLALFSSEQEHFISTITPGSEDEYTG